MFGSSQQWRSFKMKAEVIMRAMLKPRFHFTCDRLIQLARVTNFSFQKFLSAKVDGQDIDWSSSSKGKYYATIDNANRPNSSWLKNNEQCHNDMAKIAREQVNINLPSTLWNQLKCFLNIFFKISFKVGCSIKLFLWWNVSVRQFWTLSSEKRPRLKLDRAAAT